MPMIATNIVDTVLVPESLQPGPHLLSWRWVRVPLLLVPCMDVLALRTLAVQDCEQTNQVWQNCADVEIV